MIDINKEKPVSFAEASRVTPGRPHVATFGRWSTKGIKGVVLETVRFGGKRLTSLEAIQRFVEAVTIATDGDKTAPPITSRQRQAEIRRAERLAERSGV